MSAERTAASFYPSRATAGQTAATVTAISPGAVPALLPGRAAAPPPLVGGQSRRLNRPAATSVGYLHKVPDGR
jgi:hypothetical protein